MGFGTRVATFAEQNKIFIPAMSLGNGVATRTSQINKSFLVLFFKKELLPSKPQHGNTSPDKPVG